MGETSYVLVSPAEYETAKAEALKMAQFGIAVTVFRCPVVLSRWLVESGRELPEWLSYELLPDLPRPSLESGQTIEPSQ